MIRQEIDKLAEKYSHTLRNAVMPKNLSVLVQNVYHDTSETAVEPRFVPFFVLTFLTYQYCTLRDLRYVVRKVAYVRIKPRSQDEFFATRCGKKYRAVPRRLKI